MTITMIIITAILSLASATGQYSLSRSRHACDEDAARALKRPWPAEEIASRPMCLHARTVLDPSQPSTDVELTGDWRLNTGSTPRDDRGRRSGWLSDKPGSLIRFRVDAAGAQLSITYLASFANFGPFRVWAGGRPHSPGAVSVEVEGRRDRFSLPRVARFPSTSELMRALRQSGGDLFIENSGTADGPSRVKILGVVSADCH